MSSLLHRIGSDEDGSMIITVIIFLPVVVAFGIFVIDVGNAFEHRRHLQLQADAGVFATGQEFTRCYTDPTGANAAIKQKAAEYSGGTHNAQIGEDDAQSRVRTILNGPGYDGPPEALGEPCETGFIDIKLTEEDAPPIFSMLGLHDYHAHARLRVLRLLSSDRLLPIAAEDPVPRWAAAIFVDESTGVELARTELDPNGLSGDLAIWDNSAAPVSVPITAEHVGVRIALSGKPGGGDCDDPLVVCYDRGALDRGLAHIQGWTAEGATSPGGAPIAQGVELYQGTCAVPYFTSSPGCTFGVRAQVEFAVAPTDGQVRAIVDGTTYPLTYDPATGWSTGAVIPAAAESGPVDVELEWEQTSGTVGAETCKVGGGNKCTGSFGVLQRTFEATPDRSGPIGAIQMTEGGVPIANSMERCSTIQLSCSHEFVVSVGIEGALQLSEVGGPPVRLRIVQENGASQNQSLDCDPSQDRSSLKDELWLGCRPQYTSNTGTVCPGATNDLWSSPEPWACVANQTGQAANQIAAGLNCRILRNVPETQHCDGKADVCTAPNRWPDVRSGDPRVVYVIVTPFGSFSGSGSGTVPVLRLAAFYITGWMGQGGGFQNPCLSAGDEMPLDNAEIVGRFIKYIETPNSGGTGNETCDLNSVDVCAAVLVE